jgi:hypothetical protein
MLLREDGRSNEAIEPVRLALQIQATGRSPGRPSIFRKGFETYRERLDQMNPSDEAGKLLKRALESRLRAGESKE